MNTGNISFQLPAEAIRAAAVFSSRDKAQYVLNGIHCCCHEGRALVVSTDGRQMIVLDVTNKITTAWPEGMRLQFRKEELLALIVDSRHILTCEVDGQFLRVADKIQQWEFKARLIDGDYPSWWEVFELQATREERLSADVCFDVQRLDVIAKTIAVWNSGQVQSIKLLLPKNNGAMVVTDAGGTLTALLMPCRNDEPAGIPGRLLPVLQAKQAESAAKREAERAKKKGDAKP